MLEPHLETRQSIRIARPCRQLASTPSSSPHASGHESDHRALPFCHSFCSVVPRPLLLLSSAPDIAGANVRISKNDPFHSGAHLNPRWLLAAPEVPGQRKEWADPSRTASKLSCNDATLQCCRPVTAPNGRAIVVRYEWLSTPFSCACFVAQKARAWSVLLGRRTYRFGWKLAPTMDIAVMGTEWPHYCPGQVVTFQTTQKVGFLQHDCISTWIGSIPLF